MAITIDSTEEANISGGATNLSWSHTCSGPNRILVVKVMVYGYPLGIYGVTYGGVAMTPVPSGTSLFTALSMYMAVFYLADPSLGAATIDVTTAAGTNTILGLSESWNGSNGVVRGVAVTDAEYTGGGSTAPSGSYQLGVVAGDLVTAFFGNDSYTVPTPTGAFGFLVAYLNSEDGNAHGVASFYKVAPATSAGVMYGYTGIAGTGYLCIAFVIESGSQGVGPTRSTPVGLLASPTRCTAVLITRTDGTKFGLTDSQWPFEYGGVLYQTAQGADASNVHQETGTGVGDLEVSTLLDDALNYVKAADVRGTRYNNSFWLLFLIDYMDPGNGIMILNRYRCAKWSGTDTSMKFVLKGLLSILDQATGRTYSPQCDVARFGDLRCDPGQTIRAAMTDSLTCYSVGIVDALFTTDWTGSARGAGFYTFGDATFTAGANTGLEGQIKQHTVLTPAAWSGVATYALGDYSTESGTTYISLQPHNLNNDPATSPAWWLAMAGMPASIARLVWRTPPPYVVAIADVADVCFGCDRRQLTCSGVPNADATTNPSTTNIENFHGYYLPNPDQLNVVGRPI